MKLGFKFEAYLGAGAFGEAWKCSILNVEYKKKYNNSEFVVAKFQVNKEGMTSSAQVNLFYSHFVLLIASIN